MVGPFAEGAPPAPRLVPSPPGAVAPTPQVVVVGLRRADGVPPPGRGVLGQGLDDGLARGRRPCVDNGGVDTPVDGRPLRPPIGLRLAGPPDTPPVGANATRTPAVTETGPGRVARRVVGIGRRDPDGRPRPLWRPKEADGPIARQDADVGETRVAVAVPYAGHGGLRPTVVGRPPRRPDLHPSQNIAVVGEVEAPVDPVAKVAVPVVDDHPEGVTAPRRPNDALGRVPVRRRRARRPFLGTPVAQGVEGPPVETRPRIGVPWVTSVDVGVP